MQDWLVAIQFQQLASDSCYLYGRYRFSVMSFLGNAVDQKSQQLWIMLFFFFSDRTPSHKNKSWLLDWINFCCMHQNFWWNYFNLQFFVKMVWLENNIKRFLSQIQVFCCIKGGNRFLFVWLEQMPVLTDHD